MPEREASHSFRIPGWHDTPRVVRRIYWILMVAIVLMPGGIVAVAMLLGWPSGSASLVFVGSVMVAATLGARLALRAWQKRLLRRLDAAGDRLCTECGYDLRAHDGPAGCPECGAAIDVEAVVVRWHAFRARMFRRKP